MIRSKPRPRRPTGAPPARGAVLALLAVVPVAAAAQSVPDVRAGDVLLVGGRLFDGTGDQLRPNPGIHVRNGTLLRVGWDGPAPDPTDAGRAGAVVLRLGADQTILPGLFDLHAHYAVDLFGEGRVDEYRVNPVVFLANGVTSTFPGGEVDPEGMRQARIEIDAGLRPGPRIYNSGPYYGTARPGWRDDAVGPDSVRAEVDRWAELGARGFKAKGIGPAHLDALVSQAHQHGLTVTAHLDSGFRGSVNPAEAIRLGIDRIEHFMGGDATPPDRPAYSSLEALDVADSATAAKVDAQVRLFVEHGVFFDATLTAYGYFADPDPPVYRKWTDEMAFLTPYARGVVQSRLPRDPLEQFARIYHVKRGTVKRFFDGGGARLLTLGTDHPSWGEYLSGFGAHRELHALVLAGVPPAAALRAGTVNGARALGVEAKLGTIEAGKWADLFVVRGDPLQDITTTRNVVWVMKAGRVWEARALLESVKGQLGPTSEGEAGWWKGSERFEGS